MPSEIELLIKGIHATPMQIVLAVTGGGSRAISSLLEVPGASRTVLEAVVPYAQPALTRWLGGQPDQACSISTARAMAMAAYHRACTYHHDPWQVAGIACTASLTTDRPKRGAHRVYLAAQTAASTSTHSLELVKGRRTRAEEEELVTRMLLNLVAEVCGLPRRLLLQQASEEWIDQRTTVAPPAWRELLLGKLQFIRHGRPTDYQPPTMRAIFPGAFHPIHAGHRHMAEVARQLLAVPVEYELSILNVDKPPLDYMELEQRTEQFSADEVVWLTRAPTFAEKSKCFPHVTFLVGVDTIQRISDPRYYGGNPAARDAALATLAAQGGRFLVFGRQVDQRFVTLSDLDLPDKLKRLCRQVPAEQFRMDVSSTAIRQGEDKLANS
jgi:nicotinamide mononucleotide (NMN) deamidase PncC